jgi:DNA polymerase elongation subunit (family B)
MNSLRLNYGDLEKQVVEWIDETGNLDRILCIDLETKVLDGEFVTGERILAVSLGYMHGDSIESRVIVLRKDDDSSELELLREFDKFLLEVRPLVLIGFNLTGYDIPLLNMKLRKYSDDKLWGIADALGRCYVLDMKHPIRFELAKFSGSPKFVSLRDVVNHQRFASLPLMRSKNVLTSTNKGQEIFELWRKNGSTFKNYAEGDTRDVLLIFLNIFKLRIHETLESQTV